MFVSVGVVVCMCVFGGDRSYVNILLFGAFVVPSGHTNRHCMIHETSVCNLCIVTIMCQRNVKCS